jgi:hypothetical protein
MLADAGATTVLADVPLAVMLTLLAPPLRCTHPDSGRLFFVSVRTNKKHHHHRCLPFPPHLPRPTDSANRGLVEARALAAHGADEGGVEQRGAAGGGRRGRGHGGILSLGHGYR